MLGVLKLGEQDRQHWRYGLPSPSRTSFDAPHLINELYAPTCMDGWTRGSITVNIEPVQDPWHLISELLLKWQEVCQEPHGRFTFP